METEQKLIRLFSDISKQEQALKEEAIALQNEGLYDEEMDALLRTSLHDLQNRRELLIQEFHISTSDPMQEPRKNQTFFNNLENAHRNPEKSIKKCENSRRNHQNSELKVKNQENKPEISDNSSDSSEKPLIVELKVETEAKELCKQVQPITIFPKKTSPCRGKSPSALRYSPQLSPSSERIERKRTFDFFSNTDSPLCSTRSSASSFDKLLGQNTFNFDTQKEELIRKYQEQREIRNKAHEEMLLLKEKMLKEKEIKLENMMKFIISNGKTQKIRKIKSEEGNFQKECLEVDESKMNKSRQGVKPPRSPRTNDVNRSKTIKNDSKIVNFI